jgi:hypothetical protein
VLRRVPPIINLTCICSIEGLTGERAIYKKRGEDDPELGLFQDKPKRMNFVFDLSARYSLNRNTNPHSHVTVVFS